MPNSPRRRPRDGKKNDIIIRGKRGVLFIIFFLFRFVEEYEFFSGGEMGGWVGGWVGSCRGL